MWTLAILPRSTKKKKTLIITCRDSTTIAISIADHVFFCVFFLIYHYSILFRSCWLTHRSVELMQSRIEKKKIEKKPRLHVHPIGALPCEVEWKSGEQRRSNIEARFLALSEGAMIDLMEWMGRFIGKLPEGWDSA